MIIKNAAYECSKRGGKAVGTEHLLLAILMMRESMAVKLLGLADADVASVGKKLLAAMGADDFKSESNANGKQTGSADDGDTELENLGKYGRDMTEMAREGKLDPVIGRDSETERVIQILSRRTKNNPCLIGEPGVGKTAVVEGLAQRIVSGNVPEELKGTRLVSLDVSGMKTDMESLIKEVNSIDKVSGTKLISIE